MRIDLDYDSSQFAAEAAAYIDTTVRPAISAGLEAAADKVRQELTAELERDLDMPVDFTKRGIWIYKSGTRQDDIEFTVFVRSMQSQYLKYQIDGGVRRAGDYQHRIAATARWTAGGRWGTPLYPTMPISMSGNR
ncbi:hypothetical protein [Devosia salina]|uniref:HK97 gp10 family phage protein n=1 Tax=Devosia salina TaxID=2860336 RepID=A0ABX8WHN0_9HYPH|nr:hypothetical protein [Devosia salina]QYO78389.1 hypothetical protein K1X15_07540 [Devosia salina]